MEFFNLSISTSVPTQKAAAETVQGLVRGLSAELRQRLAGGESLSAKVLESSPKSAQIEVAGRVYSVRLPEARSSNLPSVITLRTIVSKRQLLGQKLAQTIGQNRETPVEIRLDSRSAPAVQSPTATGLPQASSSVSLSSVNGLLVRAEMLKPVSQPAQANATTRIVASKTAAPATVTGSTVNTIKAAAPTATSTTVTSLTATPATIPKAASAPVVSQNTITLASNTQNTQNIAKLPSILPQQAQNPTPHLASSSSNPRVSISPPSVSPSSSVSLMSQNASTGQFQPTSVTTDIAPSRVSVPTQIPTQTLSQASPVQSRTQSVSVPQTTTPAPAGATATTTVTTAVPTAITPTTITNGGTNPTITVQSPAQSSSPSSINISSGIIPSRSVGQHVLQAQQVFSLQVSSPFPLPTAASVTKPDVFQTVSTRGSSVPNATSAVASQPAAFSSPAFTVPRQSSPSPAAPIASTPREQPATTARSETPMFARFTQSYQQAQQRANRQSLPQVAHLAQWTKSGQTIQLQIYDPRLAPKNAAQIQGMVTGSDTVGRTIIATQKGQIAVSLPRPISVGAEIAFTEPASVHSTAGRLRFGAIESLLSGVSGSAAQTIKAGLPQPNALMPHSMLFFLVALRQNSGLQSWWGSGLQQEVRLNVDQLNAAEEEFKQAQPAPLQADPNWQSYSLPLQVGDDLVKLLFYWRGGHGSSEDGENSDKNIFAIEGYQHDIGRFRLDGQFLGRQLNLQWASDRPLEPKVERG